MQAKTASRSEWLEARLALMEKERALTLLKDEVTAQRQALPLVAVEKDYRFQTETGEKSLGVCRTMALIKKVECFVISFSAATRISEQLSLKNHKAFV